MTPQGFGDSPFVKVWFKLGLWLWLGLGLGVILNVELDFDIKQNCRLISPEVIDWFF